MTGEEAGSVIIDYEHKNLEEFAFPVCKAFLGATLAVVDLVETGKR